jgi:signal transduction histidine kinase
MNTTWASLKGVFWWSVGLVVAYNALFLLLLLNKPGTAEQLAISSDIGVAIGWLLGILLCFVGFRGLWRSEVVLHHPAQRWVPLLFAGGILGQFIGQLIALYYDMHHWKFFPAWPDAAYLSTYPLLLAAILLLPTRRIPGVTHWRVTLDAFIIMTGLVIFSWYFIVGPTMLQGNETVFAKVVGSVYPFVDLVLIFCVLRFVVRVHDSQLWSVILLLSLALLIIIVTDTVYDYQNLQGTYEDRLLVIGWVLGYMLLGLVAQAFNLTRSQQSKQSEIDTKTPRSPTPFALAWYSFLPYAIIPVGLALMIYTWNAHKDPLLDRGVYLGGILLICLVIIRQLLAIREHIFYSRELQAAQQELRSKNADLQQVNRLLEDQAAQITASYEQQRQLNQLKDQLLFNVNHELRTPLTEIQGYLELLREHAEKLDATMQTTFITRALHGCEVLQLLISNVLDATRSDISEKTLHLEVIAVKQVVSDVLDLFELQKRAEYQIELHIPDALIVHAHQQSLHQILLNLLSNAFKYMPPPGTITISAYPYQDTYSQGKQTVSHACICVQDEGPGIPPAEITLLFGKFVRLQRDIAGSIRGTGLGLYISKQLVEAMKGEIWIESPCMNDKGSRFCFTLPSATPTLTTTSHNALTQA